VRVALLIVCLLTTSAHADTWYKDRDNKRRILHFAVTGVVIAAYPATQFLEDDVECRWCGGPNGLDRSLRNAVLWSDIRTPARASDVTSYLLEPSASIGLVLAGTLAEPSPGSLLDDMLPIAESVIVTNWVTRLIKISAARTRPYAHFTDERGSEDNLSFPSGHTSNAFAFATSAAMVAHLRGYKSEPYIWVAGLTLAGTTGYLRMAADRHYLTDVIVGASIGVSAGLTVPFLMRRTNVTVVPSSNGVAVVGGW